MIRTKTKEEIEILREGGKRLALILSEVAKIVVPGRKTKDLDDLAYKLATEKGDKPAFLNYKPYGATRRYPASICVSINDEVVHGIPNESDREIKEGDVVSLDMGLVHRGLITDSAITVPAGKVDEDAINLMERTKGALFEGIKICKAGVKTGDIGFAIEKYVRQFGYGIVEELCGHGVGYEVHEDPYVPNYGEKGKGEMLKAGTVIAIEPMLNEGTRKITLDKDGYTYRTKDGRRSAHFEHTIVITKGGAEILTSK